MAIPSIEALAARRFGLLGRLSEVSLKKRCFVDNDEGEAGIEAEAPMVISESADKD